MAPPETPAEGAARKARRRWLSLGETVGVLALVISAASLWDSHQERAETRAEATRSKQAPAVPLVLTATVDDDGRTLKLAANRDRIIQTQTLSFPKALGIDPVDTVGNPRMEAAWFESELRKAIPEPRGAGRLPVAIVTRYTDDGKDREDRAVYVIGHGWRTRLLQSDVPVMEGISLAGRGKDVQAMIDARWAKAHPPKG